MNEDIVKKLIKQATEDVLGVKQVDQRLYADLVVKECADWVVDNAESMDHLGPEYFVAAMRKDFGVE
jgi:hypothetical protein